MKRIAQKEPINGNDRFEEYVSENLEDYCDFILDFGDNERLIRTVLDAVGRLVK